MTHCLFCQTELLHNSSWRRFLMGELAPIICEKCEGHLQYSSEADAIYFYNDFMKDILHQFKFSQDIRIAAFFARALSVQVKKLTYDAIMPIPMHPEMEELRTFAHMDAIFAAAHLPVVQYLEKTTIEQQSKKTREQRGKVSQLFRLKTTINSSDQKIILVDDLRTSGTTLAHAEKVLLEAGVKNVTSIVLISGKL